MFEPLRFLHVADAGLDQPLRNVGPLSSSLQSIAEDATLAAFENLIDNAIEHAVDFVLFAGNTFREADQSLRARLQLLQGLNRLDERQIAVFVLPGQSDPEAAWSNIPNLPNNVTLLLSSEWAEHEPATPVAMMREGRVIATITAGTLAQLSAGGETPPAKDNSIGPKTSTNGHARVTPFRVGLLSAWPTENFSLDEDVPDLAKALSACRCDYLSVPAGDPTARQWGWKFEPGQTVNTQDGIAHHPGRLQALAARETGPHGATLIEVDKDGEIRGTFLPCASVRRLQFFIPVEPHANMDEIRESVESQFAEESPQLGEQAWLVNWVLQGCGAFFESLRETSLQHKLLENLSAPRVGDREIRIQHRFQFQESPPPVGQETDMNDLERLYQETLDNSLAEDPALLEKLSRLLSEEISHFDSAKNQPQLSRVVSELEPQQIVSAARALGREWFGDVEDV